MPEFSVTWSQTTLTSMYPDIHRADPINVYRQTSNIACRRCSNYIFILDWTPGFNGLGKGNWKTRRGTFKMWHYIRVWWYLLPCMHEDTIGQLELWDVMDWQAHDYVERENIYETIWCRLCWIYIYIYIYMLNLVKSRAYIINKRQC